MQFEIGVSRFGLFFDKLNELAVCRRRKLSFPCRPERALGFPPIRGVILFEETEMGDFYLEGSFANHGVVQTILYYPLQSFPQSPSHSFWIQDSSPVQSEGVPLIRIPKVRPQTFSTGDGLCFPL